MAVIEFGLLPLRTSIRKPRRKTVAFILIYRKDLGLWRLVSYVCTNKSCCFSHITQVGVRVSHNPLLVVVILLKLGHCHHILIAAIKEDPGFGPRAKSIYLSFVLPLRTAAGCTIQSCECRWERVESSIVALGFFSSSLPRFFSPIVTE